MKNKMATIEGPSNLAQKVAFLTCIRAVPGSNSSQDPERPELFRGFPHSLHVDTCSLVTIQTKLCHAVFNCTQMWC